MKAERLRRYGELLYGPRWQSPMAAAMAKARQKPLQQAQINKWLDKGLVPEWAVYLVHMAVVEARSSMLRRADYVSHMLAADLSPEWIAALRPEPPSSTLVPKSGHEAGPDPTPET